MMNPESSTLERFRTGSALERGPEIEALSKPFRAALDEIGRVIVGQHVLLERLMIGILADGHLLLEGVPLDVHLGLPAYRSLQGALLHHEFRKLVHV